LVVVILLALVGAGCSSSSKKSAAARGGAVVGLGTIQPTGSTGVVAVGSAKQTVPADLAFVVVEDANNGLPIGNPTISGGISIGPNGAPILPNPNPSTTAAHDHDKVRAALRPLGIASPAIEFSGPDPSGNSGDPNAGTTQIEVPVAKLPKIATAVVAALEKAGVTVGGKGLRFAVLDCAAALSTARDKAIADAHQRAQALATAAGVKLGELTSMTEQPVQSSPLAYLAGNGQSPCGRASVADTSDIANLSLAALGAKPEVELTESISVSYALAATADRTIAAIGNGEVSGPADAADIVILPSPNIDLSGPAPATKIDSARVLRLLAPLGVAKKDVEVENPNTLSVLQEVSSSSYVRVHVTVERLHAVGAKIVNAVQSVAGAGSSSGVIFSASNCSTLLARARAAAAVDAGKRLDKLALAAHVKTGDIVGVAEVGANVYFPDVDPCHPDLDSLSGNGVLSALASGSSGGGIPTLTGLDANPQVTEQASLSVNRALTS